MKPMCFLLVTLLYVGGPLCAAVYFTAKEYEAELREKFSSLTKAIPCLKGYPNPCTCQSCLGSRCLGEQF